MAFVLFVGLDTEELAQIRHVAEWLSGAGHTTELLCDGRTACAVIQRAPPDVLVTSGMIPGRDGFDLASELRRVRPGPDAAVVFLLAYAATVEDHLGFRDELHATVDALLVKSPGYQLQLIVAIDHLLHCQRLRCAPREE